MGTRNAPGIVVIFPFFSRGSARNLWSDQRCLAATPRGVGNIRRFVWRKKERRFRAINSAVRSSARPAIFPHMWQTEAHTYAAHYEAMRKDGKMVSSSLAFSTESLLPLVARKRACICRNQFRASGKMIRLKCSEHPFTEP